MLIRKILERLRGSSEPFSPEHPREPLSFEQARDSFERAQEEFAAAEREMMEVQRQDEAAGRSLTRRWIAASQRADALRHRLGRAKADFVQVGGRPDTVELTELVTRKVKQWFPADEQAEAIRLLETECARNLPFCQTWDAERLESVRLAVVKLSGGQLAELRRRIEEAKLDWRDVLVYAQSPEWMKLAPFGAEEGAEVREARARDRQQYEA